MESTQATIERSAPQVAVATTGWGIWRTVVWDDPINTMSYVTLVFQRHFGFSASKADSLMMKVHTSGRATVSHGPRERMEADTAALQGYGLRATLEQDQGSGGI